MQVPNMQEILKMVCYFPGFYVSFGINTKYKIRKLQVGGSGWLGRSANGSLVLLLCEKSGKKKKSQMACTHILQMACRYIFE